jgi:hypothetical protein
MSTWNGVAAPEAATGLLDLEAADVTGTQTVVARDVQYSALAGSVARALAASMRLPPEVPWALRDDATSAFLDDDRPIGDQVAPNAKVTVTPKTHLG